MCASLSKLEALYNNGWHLNDIQHYYYFLDVLWPLLRRFVSSCGFNYGFLYPTWGSDPIQNMCLITIGFSIFFTRLFNTEKPISHAVKWNFSTIIYFPANYLNQFQIIVFLVVNLEKKITLSNANEHEFYERVHEYTSIVWFRCCFFFSISIGVFTQ